MQAIRYQMEVLEVEGDKGEGLRKTHFHSPSHAILDYLSPGAKKGKLFVILSITSVTLFLISHSHYRRKNIHSGK